ncbi:hypothetical protein Tco_0870877 [Tanacetum coccineum]
MTLRQLDRTLNIWECDGAGDMYVSRSEWCGCGVDIVLSGICEECEQLYCEFDAGYLTGARCCCEHKNSSVMTLHNLEGCSVAYGGVWCCVEGEASAQWCGVLELL